jgi:DNA repair exonuclease SbcCD ATPase subunit
MMQAIQQVMEERKRIEVFAQESYARLNELRNALRAERAAEAAQLAQLRADLAEAHNVGEQLEREARQVRTERDLLTNELSQLKLQLAHQARQAVEFDELLQALVVEVGQREDAAYAQRVRFDAEADRLREEIKTLQEREASQNEQLSKARETANKAVQSEPDGSEGGDAAEMAAMIEQVEAEIREQQEALRKERQALTNDRAELEKWRRSQIGAPPPSAGAPLSDSNMLLFDCKHCHKALQVKSWLAGLVTKCTHCGKMSPVPKG